MGRCLGTHGGWPSRCAAGGSLAVDQLGCTSSCAVSIVNAGAEQQVHLVQQRLDHQFGPARRALGRLGRRGRGGGQSVVARRRDRRSAGHRSHRTRSPRCGNVRVPSSRRFELAALIGRAYTKTAVSSATGDCESTVATRVHHILARLGMDSRAQAAVRGAQRSLTRRYLRGTGI